MQKTGAAAYVSLTDLPEKDIKIEKPKEEIEEAPVEPAEGEEGAEAEAEPAPEEGDGEEAEKPPKFKPKVLEYVAATSADEKLLSGKRLLRPAGAGGEDEEEAEEEEGAKPAGGNAEGVRCDLSPFCQLCHASPRQ